MIIRELSGAQTAKNPLTTRFPLTSQLFLPSLEFQSQAATARTVEIDKLLTRVLGGWENLGQTTFV